MSIKEKLVMIQQIFNELIIRNVKNGVLANHWFVKKRLLTKKLRIHTEPREISQMESKIIAAKIQM
jgi:hypothetical protein